MDLYIKFLIFWTTPIVIIFIYYCVNLFKSKEYLLMSKDDVTIHTDTRYNPNFLQFLKKQFNQTSSKFVIVNATALGILFIFICFYISLILYQENFGGSDESQLILTTLMISFTPRLFGEIIVDFGP